MVTIGSYAELTATKEEPTPGDDEARQFYEQFFAGEGGSTPSQRSTRMHVLSQLLAAQAEDSPEAFDALLEEANYHTERIRRGRYTPNKGGFQVPTWSDPHLATHLAHPRYGNLSVAFVDPNDERVVFVSQGGSPEYGSLGQGKTDGGVHRTDMPRWEIAARRSRIYVPSHGRSFDRSFW